MTPVETEKRTFTGYEYKKIIAPKEQISMYVDCYESFGWFVDENIPVRGIGLQSEVQMKRDRKLINKTELTRLQHHFESCADEIKRLEKSKTSAATMWAIMLGLVGTAFIAGSVFAVTNNPPIIWLCIILAIPGFAGWALPCFLYRYLYQKKSQKLQRFIEEKQEELYEICEKGQSLL